VVVHTDKTLEGIIVEEVTKKMMTTEIVIARDLKSAKSFDGTDVKQLLSFPISEFLKVIKGEKQQQLLWPFQKGKLKLVVAN